MTTYKLILGDDKQPCGVLKDASSSIPFAEGNTDYQAYLLWISEGNIPTPADEPTA